MKRRIQFRIGAGATLVVSLAALIALSVPTFDAQGQTLPLSVEERPVPLLKAEFLACDRASTQTVLTTEKDAVRLKAVATSPRTPWWMVPMEASIEPGAVFADWLASRVRSARAAARHAAAGQAR